MASSTPAQAEHPITREGTKLVIPMDAGGQAILLPPFCVKCGAPADGTRVEQSFRWSPGNFEYFTRGALELYFDWFWYLLGRILGRAVAHISGKRMSVLLHLCAPHSRRRHNMLIAARVFLVVTVAGALAVFCVSSLSVAWTLPIVSGFVARFLYLRLEDCSISAESVDQDRGIFSGCGEAFLQHFPPRWKAQGALKNGAVN